MDEQDIRSYSMQIQNNIYSQTLLVSTPEDPPNCYSLSVVLANHIRSIMGYKLGYGMHACTWFPTHTYISIIYNLRV